VPTEQKGLSQFDAPAGSLLAYATSPGNTAADGEGPNGLYTEHLLREIRVPGAKIEDVLKRVRLNVRRKSNGQQIPWESTSLEDDFYFVPPQHIKKLSEAEIERQFNAELVIWEKIKNAKEPGPLVDYLEKNPSGRFAELAQFQLDRVLKGKGEKKIQAAVAADNPFTKGTAHINTQYKIGDSYSYRVIDLFTKIETSAYVNKVTQITEDQVVFSDGALVTDLLGNLIRNRDGRTYIGFQLFISEYTVGKKWTTRFRVTQPNGTTSDSDYEFKVVGREKVTMPAGTFDAFRVEGEGWARGSFGSNSLKFNYWTAPGIRRPLASEVYQRNMSGKILTNERTELTAFLEQ
jgi:hypothetical protein